MKADQRTRTKSFKNHTKISDELVHFNGIIVLVRVHTVSCSWRL